MKDITIEEKGRAKINLALHVTGVRADGYHVLDSIVIFTDIFDSLVIKKDSKPGISFTGKFSSFLDAKKNSIIRVSKLFENAPLNGFYIRIEKNLPVGAGLGGGSADAAAIIRFITNHLKYPMPSNENISKIGADIPACVLSVASRVGGIGETVRPINISAIDLWIVLVNPHIFVSTRSIFEDVIKKHNEPLEFFDHFSSNCHFIEYLKRQRNDLQTIAVNKWPEIKKVLLTIEKTEGVLLSRMSGSGSTCFGLYKNQEIARKAVGFINKQNNGWWIRFSKVN